MEEIWKDIKFTDTDGKEYDYTGLYQISNMGRVYSSTSNKILKQNKNKDGYCRVILYSNKKGKMFYIHRLVASCFINNSCNYKEVNHKNEDKTLNTVYNLEWCNREYNLNYGTRIKRAIKTKSNVDMKTRKKVIWLNTKEVFNSINEASQWCGLKSKGSIPISCKNKKRTAGKHPITKEKLKWMYYDKYLEQREKTKNSKLKCDLEFFII